MVSFRGQKKLGPRPDRSPLGVNSKFPTSIPTPLICGFPPGFFSTLVYGTMQIYLFYSKRSHDCTFL